MLKRSFLAIPLVAMLSMSLLTACGDKKEAAAPAKEEKVLRVGTNPTFAPFEFQAKGSNDLTGFDIDLAKALGKQMGYKVELVNLGFDSLPATSTWLSPECPLPKNVKTLSTSAILITHPV